MADDLQVGDEVVAPEAPAAPGNPAAPFWEAATGMDLGAEPDAPETAQALQVGDEVVAPASPEVMQLFDRAAALEQLYKSSQWKSPDQHARVLAAKQATGAPADLIEANIEGFERAATLAEGKGLEAVRGNRILMDVLFKDREAAPLIFSPPEQGYIQKLHTAMQDVGHLAWEFAAPGKRWAADAPVVAMRKFLNLATESETRIPDQATIDKRDEYLATPQPKIDARQDSFMGRVTAFTKRSYQEQIQRAGLGGELLNLVSWDRSLDLENQNSPDFQAKKWKLEKEIADFDEKLAPTDFGARGVETLLGEALNLIPSQAASLAGGLGAATVTGALTYTAALAITRNPAAAAALASEAWGIGAATGAFASSFWLERSNAFLDMRKQGMADDFAIPMANIYGAAAAGTEVLALGKVLDMAGAYGQLAKSMSRAKFNQALLADATMGRIAKDFMRRTGEGVLAESSQEAFQDLLQDSTTYLGNQLQKYGPDMTKWESPDIHGSIDSAAETFIKTGIGTAILGLPLGGINVTTQVNRAVNTLMKDEAYHGASKVSAIIDFVRGSTLARAKPGLVADLIRGESAQSGLPVDTIYVKAQKFMRVFQTEEQGDWVAAAMELGGQPLVDRIKAEAAQDGKIAIPLEEYVAKWAGKPIAEKLAGDTTVRQYAASANDLIENQERIRAKAKEFREEFLKGKPAPKSDAERAAMEMFLSDQARTVMDPKDADVAMELFRAFINTQAWSFAQEAKPGQTPMTAEQLFADYVVEAHKARAAEAGVTTASTQTDVRLNQEGRDWTRVDNGDGTTTFYSSNPDGTDARVDTIGERRDDGIEGATPNSPARPSEAGRDSTRPDGAPSSSDIQGIRDETGAPVSDAGTLNAGATVERLFQTEDWQGWFDKFKQNALVKKVFSAKAIEQLRAGMEHARLIFGRAYEQRIMPTEYLYEFDDEGNVKLDKKTGKPIMLNPLRENEDFDESFDLSTICPRQDTFTNTVHALERRLGKILSPTQRHLIGVMIQQHGDQPACWYCYGQAARNAFDQTVANDANIARAYVALMKKTKGKATPAMLAPLFADDVLGFHYTPTGILGQYLEANWKTLSQEGVPNEVELRDMVMGYAPAKLVSHRGLAAAAGSHAQAATKANQPKQWAMLQFQFLDKGPEWVEKKNARAGLRFNSQTDIRGWHLIDLPQAFGMAQAIGLMAHVYTKERDFLLIFGKTGMKFNLSAAYITKGGVLQLDARGKPIFDSVFGMAGEDIERFIKELPQVAGGMLVAHNDLALWAGLEDDRIHQIIPYHKGKVSAPINFFEDARDYTDYQAEIWTRRGSPGKYFIRAPDGEWYKAGTPWMVTLKSGETVSVPLGWSTDHSHHKSDLKRYLEICEGVGCAPKFALSNKMGSPPLVVTKPDGTKIKLIEKNAEGHWVPNHPEYMKLVRDVARDPQNQKALDASKINWQELHRAQKEWIDKGGDDTKANPKLVGYIEDRIRRGDWPADKKMPTEDDVKSAQARAKMAKTKQAKGLAREIAGLGELGQGLPAVPGLLSAQEARVMEEDKGVVRGWTDTLREGVKTVLRIALTEHANKSTFLHESGHVFLKLMRDLAVRAEAPERLKKDWAAVEAWLGAAPGEALTRDQQEKWARTFEAYLMTGKAPSLALVRPFTRFKVWLTGIYNQIKNIPEAAELDPEIAGIFDRMLATDREIENTKKQMGLQQLFRSPEEAGMTPEQWKAYVEAMADTDLAASERVQATIVREMLRELEAWWKDESAAIAKQIGDQYDESPGWLAYRFVKLGDTGGNPVLEAFKDLDLNKKATLAALKGAGGYYSRTVMKKLAGKVLDAGVLTPDELGAVFGRTGTEILRDMLDLPSRERFVKEETARIMAERHGDVVAEQERLKETVADALHEGGQLHYLMHEYDVLYRKANKSSAEGGLGLPVTSMELAAAEIVGAGQVLEVSAPRALAAERQASEQAFQAMAAGDYARALAAKQKQILHMLIYRESKQAREDVKKFQKLLEKMNDEKRRGTLGLADQAYLNISDAILWALRVRPVPTDPLALKDLKDLKDLENRLMLDGLEPAFARDVIEDILGNPPAPPIGPTGKERPAWLALTVEQMREVMALLEQIKRAANEERRVQLDGIRMAVQGVAGTIAGESRATHDKGKQPGTESAMGSWYRVQMLGQKVNSELSNPQYIFERLGPTAERFFWNRMNAAQQVETKLFKKVYLAVEAMWKKLPAKDRDALNRTLDVADLPYPADVDRNEETRNILWLVMVAANMGNLSNQERLLKGYEWEQAQVIAALEKYLTHDQMAWVRDLWDLMDKELYPEMAEVYRRVNGVLPRKIEASPLTLTIDGVTKTYRGGYWPARYDHLTKRGRKQEDGPMMKMLGTSAQATTMNRSFTKARAEHFSDVINLDWGVLPAHLFDLIHYVATDEAARDMYRVMQNGDFQTAARHAVGEADLEAMDAWLKVFAAGPRVAAAAAELKGMAYIFGWTGGRFRMGVLGASMQTVLGDIPAPVLAITDGEVSSRYMIPAMISGATGAGWFSMRKFALANSPWLQTAKEHWKRRAVEELAKPLKKARNQKAKEMLTLVREAAWLPFEAMERVTSTIVWYAKYHQNVKVLGHDQAVLEADKTLDHMYPSHDPTKQAPIVRSRNSQIWNAFYSFFSSRYSQTRRTWHPAANRFLEEDGVASVVKTIPPAFVAALQTIGGLAAMNVLSELLSGRGPEEDEKVPTWMLRKMLEGGFMLFPLGGELYNVGKSVVPEIMGDKSVRINERAAPITSALYAIGKALQKAADSDAPGFDRTLAAGETLAWLAKLPVSQPKRTIKYWKQGENKSLSGRISGTIYGERKNQPKNIATWIGGRR